MSRNNHTHVEVAVALVFAAALVIVGGEASFFTINPVHTDPAAVVSTVGC